MFSIKNWQSESYKNYEKIVKQIEEEESKENKEEIDYEKINKLRYAQLVSSFPLSIGYNYNKFH